MCWGLVIVGLAVVVVTLYSCLVMAGRSDEQGGE